MGVVFLVALVVELAAGGVAGGTLGCIMVRALLLRDVVLWCPWVIPCLVFAEDRS